MSNQVAMQQTIDLTGVIDLNKNKNTIRQFDGFTKRNSPFINGGLSPLVSEKNNIADVIDRKGDRYYMNNGYFYKNDKTIKRIYNNKNITAERNKNKSYLYKNSLFLGRYNNKEVYLFISEDRITFGDPNPSDYLAKTITENFVISDVINNTIVFADYDNFENQWYIKTIYLSSLASGGEHHYIQADIKKILSVDIISSEGWTNTKILITYIDNNNITNTLYYNWSNGVGTEYIINNSAFSRKLNYSISSSFVNLLSLTPEVTDNVSFEGKIGKSITINEIMYDFTDNTENVVPIKTWYVPNDYIALNNAETLKLTYNKGILISYTCKLNFANGEILYINNDCLNGQVIDDEGNVDINTSIRLPGFNGGLLFNNNEISGISFEDVLLTDFLTVNTNLTRPIFIHNSSSYQVGMISYININNENIYIKTSGDSSIKLLYDRYIILNDCTVYDTETDSFSNIFMDWNNRLIPDSVISKEEYPIIDLRNKTVDSLILASAINTIYENSYNIIASSQFAPSKYRFIDCATNLADTNKTIEGVVDVKINNPSIIDIYVEIYASYNLEEIPKYYFTKYGGNILNPFSIDNRLKGTTYPVQTEGNILLSPSITDRFYISGLNYDSIKTVDENFYKLIYSDAQPILLYSYSSNIKDVSDIFFIQGQLFVIRNNIINSASINGNMFENVSPIVNKGNLQFLGCSPLIAYFYSIIDRFIYIFTGDRNLQKYIEISEFTEIKNSIYLPDIDSLLIATDNGLYVIDSNNYIYCVDGNFDNVTPLNNGYAAKLSNENKWNKYYYYNDEMSEKEKVVLKTSFYGVGNNQLSVIDTWYMRLYSDKKLNGETECNITTITNKTTLSSKQTFKIKSSDWDSNGYIYIRYQPQLQRGVATSLEIISDFEIYELQASINPDNTKQLSADYKQLTEIKENNGI